MSRDRLGRQFLYLSEADVSGLGLSIEEIIAALEGMFAEKAAGRVEMPPKPGLHTMPNSFLHAMPAYIPAQKAAGMKWVGGYPENGRLGLPYISGLMILNDVETGVPLALMDATWITAKRTGAATAIAAKYLARTDSHTVGILGCGVQGRSNLEALDATFDLGAVRAYDVNATVREKFARETSAQTGLEIVPISEPREAVTDCDIVVTAGPILRQPHATIQRGWFAVGSFASLVDFDSYWHPDALREVDKFCTDDLPQFEHYREMGYFQHVPPIHAELADLVAGRKPGREAQRERTMACNLGLALDDIAVAPLVYHRALARGVGTWLPL
jgi:ornithine cyclodeaminase/alanine dehydrogenase-like protein (mu-crystallin family)